MRPEGEWDAQIEGEIASAKAVVVLWTPRSTVSRWVRAEAHHAQDRNVLLPVKLEPCDPPIAFALTQTINLTDWRGESEDRQFKKLLIWIGDLVKDARAFAPGRASATGPQAPLRGTLGQTRTGEDILDGATISLHTPAGTCFADGEGLPAMRVLAAGSFLMGREPSEPHAQRSEGPAHTVTFVHPFAIGVFAVSFAEWDDIADRMGVGLRPSDAGWGRGRQPVVNVSWADASALAAALSRLTSERYRLPSESEWEYACRAGSRGPFCFREPISPQLANYDASQAFDGGAAGRSRGRTVEVGTFPPNAYGLFDMHGNVREWVQDAWHDDYHGAPGDGLAWSTGHSAMHVVRGGGWLDPPWLLRSTARGRGAKSDRANFIGFRLARDLG